MNINEVEELAKAATPGPWRTDAESGFPLDVHGENHKMVSRACEDYDSAYIAAANPSAISELIAAYRKSVAALCSVIDWDIRREYIVPYSVRDPIHRTLATAKRLGVE